MPTPTVQADPRDIIIGAHCTLLYKGQLVVSTTAWRLRMGIETQQVYFAGSMQRITYPVGYDYTLEMTRNVLRKGDVNLLDEIRRGFAIGEIPSFDFLGVVQSGSYRREEPLSFCFPMGDYDIVNMRVGQPVEQTLQFAVNAAPVLP